VFKIFILDGSTDGTSSEMNRSVVGILKKKKKKRKSKKKKEIKGEERNSQ